MPVYSIQDQSGNTGSFFIYSARNGYQLPIYHRADIGVNWKGKTEKGHEKRWSFGAFNVYNRHNVSYVQVVNATYNPGVNKPPVFLAKSLFPIIPYISFSKTYGKNVVKENIEY